MCSSGTSILGSHMLEVNFYHNCAIIYIWVYLLQQLITNTNVNLIHPFSMATILPNSYQNMLIYDYHGDMLGLNSIVKRLLNILLGLGVSYDAYVFMKECTLDLGLRHHIS